MNRWILILVHAVVALGITHQAWAQAPSPAAWLRSTGQTQVAGEERYDITLTWQQGVVSTQQPAANSFTVYRAPIGQDRALEDYDEVGSLTVNPSETNIIFVDEGVVRGAYYYYVVGQSGMSVGEPSPRCMIFAPDWYCVDIGDPVLTFTSSPKTVIEPGAEYTYTAFARHRSARVQGFVRYELVAGPDGMAIDEMTGEITWSVPSGFDEPTAVKIRAWSLDDENAEAFQEWGIRSAEPFEILIGSTSSVQEAQLLSGTVAPNPASSFVTLQFTSDYPSSVWVVDMAGQVVLQKVQVDGGLLQLSVEDLAPGRYTVMVQQGWSIQSTPLAIVR